jgi:hypothetical protein
MVMPADNSTVEERRMIFVRMLGVFKDERSGCPYESKAGVVGKREIQGEMDKFGGEGDRT